MSQWTVKRNTPEESAGGRVASYAFGVVLLGALGAGAGAMLPLMVGLGTDGRRDRRARQVKKDALDAAVHDTKDDMTSRALIGLLIGACAGGGLAYQAEQARLKKLR